MLLQGHRDETKFDASSEELMKLVESAQGGTLAPERLSHVLAAASLAVGQDCRSQLLMQLILLIQQQLAATDIHSTVTQSKTTNSSDVKLPHDDDNASLNSAVEEKPQNLNTARKRPSDIEAGNIDKENEMDKLLAWKNRIENASVASTEQQHNTVVEQSKMSRCLITEPASPDTPVQSHTETVGESSCPTDDSSTSKNMTSCVVTDVLQSVTVSHVALSPASPQSDDYPPLPTPPKPPDNLLMNDRLGLSSELFAPPLPFPPTVNSAVSVTPPVSDNAACLPCLSVPVSTDTTVSFTACDNLADAQSGDCTWPEDSAVKSSHADSYCPVIIASDAHMTLETLSCGVSRESIDSLSMKLLSTQNCSIESEAWSSGFSKNTFSPLKSVQEDHERSMLHNATTHSQEPGIQRRATRLKSPSAWMSRLASPSAFMLQSGVSRLQAAINERPEAMFVSHKLASPWTTTEPASHCGQRMPLEQRHSTCTVDSRKFVKHSDLFHPSHSEVGGQLTVRDIDVVSSDGRGCVPMSQGRSDTECRTVSKSLLSASDDLHNDGGAMRMSTDKVLMRLAGMLTVDNDKYGDLSDASSAHEPSSQNAHYNMTFSSDRGTERSGEAVALRRGIDEVMCETVVTSCDELSASSAVTVQSSQQTACHQHDELQQQQQQVEQEERGVNDDDLEEGEIVDDCSPTPTSNQHDLPQATKQLLLFLKTDPVRNSSSCHRLQHRVTAGEMTYHHQDDRRDDFYKYQRNNSSSKRH